MCADATLDARINANICMLLYFVILCYILLWLYVVVCCRMLSYVVVCCCMLLYAVVCGLFQNFPAFSIWASIYPALNRMMVEREGNKHGYTLDYLNGEGPESFHIIVQHMALLTDGKEWALWETLRNMTFWTIEGLKGGHFYAIDALNQWSNTRAFWDEAGQALEAECRLQLSKFTQLVIEEVLKFEDLDKMPKECRDMVKSDEMLAILENWTNAKKAEKSKKNVTGIDDDGNDSDYEENQENKENGNNKNNKNKKCENKRKGKKTSKPTKKKNNNKNSKTKKKTKNSKTKSGQAKQKSKGKKTGRDLTKRSSVFESEF